MRQARTKRYQKGLTLIEIMIALLIGAFLLGGVLQIFIGTKQTNKMQEGLSRLQENGRFAIDFLAKDIRVAGYKECLNFSFSVPTPITGTNDTGTYTSDTITIQTAGACAATLANTPVSATTYSIQTGAGGQPAFFVKNDTIVNGVVTSGTAQELVEGIENMQIFYGVDTNTPHDGANYYVSANQVTTSAWPNVISVRISLLAASDDNLSSQAVDYTYNSTTATTPTDLKIRRVFNATIAIRNRM